MLRYKIVPQEKPDDLSVTARAEQQMAENRTTGTRKAENTINA